MIKLHKKQEVVGTLIWSTYDRSVASLTLMFLTKSARSSTIKARSVLLLAIVKSWKGTSCTISNKEVDREQQRTFYEQAVSDWSVEDYRQLIP